MHMLVYICTKFSEKNLRQFKKFQSGHEFQTKISSGHNSAKSVSGVMVLVISTLSNGCLYSYQVSWKYFERYQSYGADMNALADRRLTDEQKYQFCGGA